MSTGWVCPKCGRVYGPFVGECASCNGHSRPLTGTTTTDVCPTCGNPRWAAGSTSCPIGAHYGVTYTTPFETFTAP